MATTNTPATAIRRILRWEEADEERIAGDSDDNGRTGSPKCLPKVQP